MYIKVAVFAIFFSIGLVTMYAGMGNSVTYPGLRFIVSDEAFSPQALIDDLENFLSSYYSVEIYYSDEGVVKYDWKKFLYFQKIFIVRKGDVYVKVDTYIDQQQPYLLHREKRNDYHIDFTFTRFVHEENEEDAVTFVEDLDNKIEFFTKKHNLKRS